MQYDYMTLMDVVKNEDYVPERGELCTNGYLYFIGDGERAICEMDNVAVILAEEDKIRVNNYLAQNEGRNMVNERQKGPAINHIFFKDDKYNLSTYIPLEGEVIKIIDNDGDYIYKLGNGKDKISDLDILKAVNNSKRGLGCLKSPYDERDYQFSDLVVNGFRKRFPREYIDVKDKIKAVFDQLDTNTCCACACAMSRYIYELNDSGNRKQFSPAYIYGNRAISTVVDGVYEGEGMYLKDAMKQLCKSGVCYYSTLPNFDNYKISKINYELKKELSDREALPFRTSSYYG